MKGKVFLSAVLLSTSMGASAAGIPVIDGANLANALQQFRQLQQQYENMEKRLENGEEQLDSMTGTNNMGAYGRSEYWNDWDQPNSRYDTYAREYEIEPHPRDSYAQETRDSNLKETRRLASESRAVDEMLDTAVERFNAINELIRKIDSSTTAKQTADLQARIAGEQAMLTNEMLKMQLLQQQYSMQRRREAARVNNRESTSLLDVVNN